MSEIITYETLYEILRKEKSTSELQRLDNNFFQKVIGYINEKSDILESQKNKKSIFASVEIIKTQKQLENIKRMLKELYERRENKILQSALFSSRTSQKRENLGLLEEEKIFYQKLEEKLTKYRKNILFKILSKKLPIIEESKDIKIEKTDTNKTKLVRFLHSLPKFVGDDLNIYGPFEAENIANLPYRVAKVLIKKRRAQEMKIER